jgi:hypothetical protein
LLLNKQHVRLQDTSQVLLPGLHLEARLQIQKKKLQAHHTCRYTNTTCQPSHTEHVRQIVSPRTTAAYPPHPSLSCPTHTCPAGCNCTSKAQVTWKRVQFTSASFPNVSPCMLLTSANVYCGTHVPSLKVAKYPAVEPCKQLGGSVQGTWLLAAQEA